MAVKSSNTNISLICEILRQMKVFQGVRRQAEYNINPKINDILDQGLIELAIIGISGYISPKLHIPHMFQHQFNFKRFRLISK